MEGEKEGDKEGKETRRDRRGKYERGGDREK